MVYRVKRAGRFAGKGGREGKLEELSPDKVRISIQFAGWAGNVWGLKKPLPVGRGYILLVRALMI